MAVADAQVAGLLGERDEQVLGEAPVDEGAEGGEVAHRQEGDFPERDRGRAGGRDRTILGVEVDEDREFVAELGVRGHLGARQEQGRRVLPRIAGVECEEGARRGEAAHRQGGVSSEEIGDRHGDDTIRGIRDGTQAGPRRRATEASRRSTARMARIVAASAPAPLADEGDCRGAPRLVGATDAEDENRRTKGVRTARAAHRTGLARPCGGLGARDGGLHARVTLVSTFV